MITDLSRIISQNEDLWMSLQDVPADQRIATILFAIFERLGEILATQPE